VPRNGSVTDSNTRINAPSRLRYFGAGKCEAQIQPLLPAFEISRIKREEMMAQARLCGGVR
jgi:hypothetical protein